MPHAEALAPALLERVLSKLGLSEPPSPTLEGLRTLYPAWCRKVPFDNIRQLIHRRSQDPSPMPGGDATEFFEAWLMYGTGGTCWHRRHRPFPRKFANRCWAVAAFSP